MENVRNQLTLNVSLQYSLFNDYSGQIVYESWTWSFYNVLFTVLPPLVIGIFDQFVSARMLDRYPQLYKLGQSNAFFTKSAFWQWIGNAFYHSIVSHAYICHARYASLNTCLDYQSAFILLFDSDFLDGLEAKRWQRHGPLVLGDHAVPHGTAHRARKSCAGFGVSWMVSSRL